MAARARSEWPEERLHAERLTDALTINALLAQQRAWIHRRVETVTFLDELRVHFGVSVDFTLPALGVSAERPEGLPIRYVPLSLIKKEVLKDFDVRDEAGRALPVLTRGQNAAVAELLLAIRAGSVLRVGLADLLDRHGKLFRDVAGSLSLEEATVDRDSDVAQKALSRFESSSPHSVSPVERERGLLWSDTLMRSTLEALAGQFILLVATSSATFSRRIIKFSYERMLDEPPGNWRDKAFQALALKRYVVRLETPGLYAAESFHLEIPTPDDVVIERGELVRAVRWADRPGSRGFRERAESSQEAVDRVGLYGVSPSSGYLRRLATKRMVEDASAEISFALQPSLLWPVASLISVSFLMFAFAVAARWGAGRHSAGDVSALIAVVPAVFGAFLIPGEHRLVRRMYSGVRVLVGLTALLSFVAGGTLVLSLPFWFRVAAWTSFACLAALASVLMFLALWRSEEVVRKPRKMGKRQPNTLS